jgi:hypothetical protein
VVDFKLVFNFDLGDSYCKQSVLLLLNGSFFLLMCILSAEKKYDSLETDLIDVYSYSVCIVNQHLVLVLSFLISIELDLIAVFPFNNGFVICKPR